MDKEGGNGVRRVATVGTFDGLHHGHRYLLRVLEREARSRGLQPMVICFDRHPLETIAPDKAPHLIQHPDDRHATLIDEGFGVLTLEFTPQLAAMNARDWMRSIHDDYAVDVLIVGYDNTFGSDGRSLSRDDYRRLGSELGMEVVEADCYPGAASSGIRKLIKEGKIEEAEALLGRRFTVKGTVVEGDKIGREIGFPTANIRPRYRALLPKEGVYAVTVLLPDGSRRPGLANIGHRPTIGNDLPLTLEVYIDDFTGNLYGAELAVEFITRLRPEMKFSSLDRLKAQIAADKARMVRSE